MRVQRVAILLSFVAVPHLSADAAATNVLFISVDDMSCDSVGAFGCKLADTTPQIDRLASEGLRFEYAHVQVGNCMPSRNVMFSGRYPHNNRVEGFYQVRDKDYPVLADLMREGGYFTSIRGKVSHSTPYHPYAWDLVLDTASDGSRRHVKNIQSYYDSAAEGIAAATEAGKPFCMLVNVSDPHKPFYAMGKKGEVEADPNKPTRVFTADEVPVPGFLPDHPDIRLELAHYYSSVRRADDCVGAVLKALDESGKRDNTVVLFLSDHGMPLPFAKTALWHHSTRTPWIVRWPGVTRAGAHDQQHMISAVDLLPTLLDIAGIKHPDKLDGRSFLPVIRGQSQSDRNVVFKEYNENSGAVRNPMRAAQTRQFLYLFNPWVDGKRKFRTATNGTISYRTMQTLAPHDEAVAARLKFFDHGVLEELYDIENDPDCLRNLIDDPTYKDPLTEMRGHLHAHLERSGDHALQPFRQRADQDALNSYMARVETEATERRNRRKTSQGRADPATEALRRSRKQARLIAIDPPASVSPGQTVSITVRHTIPEKLGKQKIHVTLKHGDKAAKRIERKVVTASGDGTLQVTFDVPAGLNGKAVSFATFIGEDYQTHLQHVASGAIPAK